MPMRTFSPSRAWVGEHNKQAGKATTAAIRAAFLPGSCIPGSIPIPQRKMFAVNGLADTAGKTDLNALGGGVPRGAFRGNYTKTYPGRSTSASIRALSSPVKRKNLL